MKQETKQIIHSLFFAVALSVGISIGVYLVLWGFVLQAESDNQDDDFIRTIRGLECHQLEQYILDMKYRWGEVIQYHSFKCVNFLEEQQLIKNEITKGVNFS